MSASSPLTKSSHLEKDTSYGIKKQDWHTAYGTADRANRLRQRAGKGRSLLIPDRGARGSARIADPEPKPVRSDRDQLDRAPRRLFREAVAAFGHRGER